MENDNKLKDLCNDPNVQVAPLIEHFLNNGDTFKKLQEIQDQSEFTNNYYNYVLKCTDGIFQGKFLYINTTPDGELFGSGNPDQLDLTMYIESANLSEKHAEIKFLDNCKYFLLDCNSETGSWVRVGHPGITQEGCIGGRRGSGIDLYQENRLRMYKAGDCQFVIEEHPTMLLNEMRAWLKANYFEQCIQSFETRNIGSQHGLDAGVGQSVSHFVIHLSIYYRELSQSKWACKKQKQIDF